MLCVVECSMVCVLLCVRERDDIQRGRLVLVDLVNRNNIPVFSDWTSALHCSVLNVKKVVEVGHQQCRLLSRRVCSAECCVQP